MNFNKIVFGAVIFLTVSSFYRAEAQDIEYARSIVSEITKPEYKGRGYVGKGDSIAAHFLSSKMKQLRLDDITDGNFQQPYSLSVTRYPKEPRVSIGAKSLVCTRDFNVYPTSPSISGTFPILWIGIDDIHSPRKMAEIMKSDLSQSFVAIDSTVYSAIDKKDLQAKSFEEIIRRGGLNAKGVLSQQKKLFWRVRKTLSNYVYLELKQGVVSSKDKTISLDIVAEEIRDYRTQNVVGYIPGRGDSTVVFMAHYDHLGMQGDHVYPGGLDNAGGVATVLAFAKEFKKRRVNHNMLFLLVSGEEGGLNGSKYFANNPLIDMDLVKLVVNFDMAGAGDGGVSIFNGKLVPGFDERVLEINGQESCFEKLSIAGRVNNSDHASFYDKGKSVISFYSKGDGEKYYHTPEDKGKFATFAALNGIYKLMSIYLEEE